MLTVYNFKKIAVKIGSMGTIKKIVALIKKIGYNMDILWQAACVVFNDSGPDLILNDSSFLTVSKDWHPSMSEVGPAVVLFVVFLCHHENTPIYM